MRRNSRPFVKREEEAQHRINDKIVAAEIRLVIEGEEPQVMSVSKGIALAEEQELDLVEISPNAKPPVCKIMDYKKFLYNQKRKQKELKAKQSKIVVKEIRFGPNTDDHDFNFKLAHAKKFLEEGSKVKAYVFFRGRTIVFKDRGEILLLKFAQELADCGVIEQLPKLEGKKMILMINSKKK
ncbi:MAG: translation initiation factor IF-3 [Crocinitomicaceae bacterium]|jgi:translation initiation factor IF-3|nr:translation initiation factor IF-3 [Crocinitomicaceae bacterium]MDP4761640.1 translation initiation factor IF-3 [Crocinitomicaceae bacterium]